MVPSGSDDAEPSKLTTSGRGPFWGAALIAAVGTWLAVTVIATVAVSVAPESSVTVSWAVKVPAVV